MQGKSIFLLNFNVFFKIIGVDPVGSVLADTGHDAEAKHFEVEGIGYDFVPKVLDMDDIDKWVSYLLMALLSGAYLSKEKVLRHLIKQGGV